MSGVGPLMDARTRDPDAQPPPSPPRPAPGGPRGRGGRDLTQGPITRTLLIFSLPLLGGNALQSLNGTVNQIWVSHTLGEIAITALGNANIVMMLMMAAVFGVSMAANILIAQFMGARDPDMVRRVMGTTTTFSSSTLSSSTLLVSLSVTGSEIPNREPVDKGTPPEKLLERMKLGVAIDAMRSEDKTGAELLERFKPVPPLEVGGGGGGGAIAFFAKSLKYPAFSTSLLSQEIIISSTANNTCATGVVSSSKSLSNCFRSKYNNRCRKMDAPFTRTNDCS